AGGAERPAQSSVGLDVVRDEIGEREAVVRVDEVDRALRAAGAEEIVVVAVQRVGPRHASRAGGVALHVTPDRVAIAAVPLAPSRRELPDFVRGAVPRLG